MTISTPVIIAMIVAAMAVAAWHWPADDAGEDHWAADHIDIDDDAPKGRRTR